MELGIGMFGDIQQSHTSSNAQTRLKEIITEAKLADEAGLDIIALGEHHRKDYAIANPEILLAAIASTTKHIKLASAVTVLSSADPVRTYENFASLDLISDNRAEIMVGRGSFIESFPLYGFNLNDYDKLFEEKLDLLLNINKNEIVNWEGTLRAPLHNQLVFPRSTQANGLPIWIAVGGTPASVERAAILGLPLIVAIIGGQPKQFKPLFDYYKEIYVASGHDINKMQVGVHAHTFLTSTPEASQNYYKVYAQQMNNIGQERNWPPYTSTQYDFGRSIHGHLLVGDEQLVIEKILQYKEWFGITRFVAHIDVGGPAHKDILKTIDILGTKVLPKIQ